MKAGLQFWGRAFLLAVLVLGTSPLHAGADTGATLPEVTGTESAAGTEACCGSEAPGKHAAECLPHCSTGGQAVLPGTIELPLASIEGFRLEPGIGADNRVADLEPDPPRRISKTI